MGQYSIERILRESVGTESKKKEYRRWVIIIMSSVAIAVVVAVVKSFASTKTTVL